MFCYEYDIDQKLSAQHEEMIQSLNMMSEALRTQFTGDLRCELLEKFMNQAQEHFNYEEQVARKHHHPDLVAFLQAKKRFMADVTRYLEQCAQGETVLSMRKVNWWQHRLAEHIDAYCTANNEGLVDAA
ncbi:MAG: hemerythrin family protein [Bacteriovoracaceae bacterium]|nr:hemerythrin family protein [Bacteriovoracaceae bacterium]